jgi:putative (di)nucleoside polyphosphate hydrolase
MFIKRGTKRVMSLPSQYFRAGVGAVIFNSRGLILALERADIPAAWQLPQGGLDIDEAPLGGALREVAEETGIKKSDLELLDVFPEPLAYELPVSAQSEKTGRGQVQYWFLFRFKGSDDSIHLEDGGEFNAWDWIPFQDLLNAVVDFRKTVYKKLAVRFEPYISRSSAANIANK